jgi:lysyl-tRNA synthetase class 2
LSEFFSDNNLLARKSRALQTRAKIIQSVRLFFIHNGFLEVETPLRIPSPAPEENIEALPSGNWFLQTSPELCMKRLVAAGYPRIFQISHCFRSDERGNKHLPEFTMLEWYVAGFDYHQLMDQCERMIEAVTTERGITEINRQNHGYEPQNKLRNVIPSAVRDCSTYKFQDTSFLKFESHNKKINMALPWERITVADAFSRYAPVGLEDALARDIFDEILIEHIEPQLGINRPTFIYDYPAKLAALAKLKENNSSVSERFELYIGGLEIANGFSELTDAREQRQRFEEALKTRAAKNWARYEIPGKFLQSLETLPPCAGIALGIDRMVMIMTDARRIDDVVAFTPEEL